MLPLRPRRNPSCVSHHLPCVRTNHLIPHLVWRQLFSLLHEDASGLEVRAPSGEWQLTCTDERCAAQPHEVDSSSWLLICGDMLELLSDGYFSATPHRVRPTPHDAARARRSLVFFLAVDELEPVVPVNPEIARRSLTGGYRRWRDGEEEEECVTRTRTRGRHAASGVATGVAGGAVDRSPALAAWKAKLAPGTAVTQRKWTELKEAVAQARLVQPSSASCGPTSVV